MRSLASLPLLLLLGGCASSRAVSPGAQAGAQCRADEGVSLQVLGSGGPIPDDARASAGYLVWIDGKARLLVDAGGGTFVRFGQAGASLDDLEVIALSHLHTDHSAELPAFLKGTYFGSRARDLVLVGPTGAAPFPSLDRYLQSMFGDSGAYAYLGWLLRDGEGAFSLRPVEVDHTARTPVSIPTDNAIALDAIGVEHGPVPALGYRVRVRGKTLVFAGDHNGNNPAFVEFARNADVLVMHHAVPNNAGSAATALHATPSQIAAIADEAGAAMLVLSHHMKRALADLDGAKRTIADRFDGDVVVAQDLTCVILEP